MTATITREEEELLIITDEEEVTDEINLDISERKEPEVEGEVISFGEEDTKEEEISSEIGTNDIDFSFDLGGEEKEVTVEDMLGEKTDSLENLKAETEKKLKIKEEATSDDIFNFDLEESNEETKVEEKVIPEIENKETEVELNFGEEKNEVPISEVKLEEKQESNVELDFDIKEPSEKKELDLEASLGETVKESSNIEIEKLSSKKEEEKNIQKEIDNSKNKKEEIKESINIEKNSMKIGKGDDNQISGTKGDDTNTILNETIKKLKARKKEILDLKKDTLDHIAELKEEIKSLQSNVRKGNTQVKHFDKETDKIEENIQLLRKMKV